MIIERASLQVVRLPLRRPFKTSFTEERSRDALIVQVESDGVLGWGECVAMEEPLYSSEYLDGAIRVTRDHLIPRLAGHSLHPYLVPQLLAPVSGHRMAKAAVEMAVLDLYLKGKDIPLAEFLGGVRSEVPVGVSVGIAESLPVLLSEVEGFLEHGYRRIKLKIEPGWDVEPVREVRRVFGDISLQVDANAAYPPWERETFKRLDEFGLVMVEQPFAEEGISAHVALAAEVSTALCLDESVVSAASALDALARGACSIVNIKPGRVGGLLEAKRIHDVCSAAGAPVWCGGMIETGIGRAANAALAALPGFSLPGDISEGSRFFNSDIAEPLHYRDGHMTVPSRPGLGVEVDSDALRDHTVSEVHEIRLQR